eukprot:5373626-Pleurochrysis_carterae.AAC.6
MYLLTKYHPLVDSAQSWRSSAYPREHSTAARCMTAQANHEVEYHLKSKVPVHVAGGPASIEMAR